MFTIQWRKKMIYLGERSDIEALLGDSYPESSDEIHPDLDTTGGPEALPRFDQEGHHLLACYFMRGDDDSLVEHLVECESLNDMREVFKKFSAYGTIRWFVGNDVAVETITEAEGFPTA